MSDRRDGFVFFSLEPDIGTIHITRCDAVVAKRLALAVVYYYCIIQCSV
jgi:hypothetical protein